MGFEYVVWRPNTPASSDRMSQMADNQQLIYDAVQATPQGVLAWKEYTTGYVYGGTSPSVIGDLSISVDIQPSRLTKVTFNCAGIYMNGGSGSTVARTTIQVNGTAVEFSEATAAAGTSFSFGTMSVVLSSLSGTKTIRVVGNVVGAGTSTPGWNAGSTYPMQLIIEDIGQYIAQS